MAAQPHDARGPRGGASLAVRHRPPHPAQPHPRSTTTPPPGRSAPSVLASSSSAPPADHGLEVRDAIARLEPRQAELVRLVHWEGFTLAEAADILGVPASTARNHYQAAKHQLRSALSPEVGAESLVTRNG